MYIIRLDDASEYMNVEKWEKMELLLDKYQIKPIVGIIPDNKDKLLTIYEKDPNFWDKAKSWYEKKWIIAMHGCTHVYESAFGGINPVQKRSEFADLPLEKQCEKIKVALKIFRDHKLEPKVFFAPSHTFDENTLIALKKESNISIISDTIANDTYFMNDFQFIPQQSGKVRYLPFKIVTFCYHPNEMENSDFEYLELFIKKNHYKFMDLNIDKLGKRELNFYDKLLRKIYFFRRR